MALVPVAIRELQALNYAAVLRPSRELRGKWVPVHSSGAATSVGVATGRIDPDLQTCIGQVVIPPYCPPPPPPTIYQEQLAGAIQAAFMDALRQAPPIVVNPSPISAPGYRGERQNVTLTRVIHGSGAGAIAAGNALLAAAGGVVGAAALGITGLSVSGATPTQVFNTIVPSGRGAQVASLRFVGNAQTAATTLFFTVMRSGRAIGPEFQFTAGTTVPLEFPANPDEVIAVMVRNPDSTGAWLCTFDLELWTYPMVSTGDSLYARVLRQNPSHPSPPRASGAGCGGRN